MAKLIHTAQVSPLNFRPPASEPARRPGRSLAALLGLGLLLLAAAWANQRLQPGPPAAPPAAPQKNAAPQENRARQNKSAAEAKSEAPSGGGQQAVSPSGAQAAAAAATEWLRPLGGDRFVTPAGLVYGPSRGEHRLEHVMRHARDDPDRVGAHGVFDADHETAVVELIDEAYRLAQSDPSRATQERDGDRIVYTITFDRRIGYQGGQAGARRQHPPCRRLTLVLEGNNVITAYPER